MRKNNQVKVVKKSNYYYLTVLTGESEFHLKLRSGINRIKSQGRWERGEYLQITNETLTHYYQHPVVKNYWVEPKTYYWQEHKLTGEKYLLLDPDGKILGWLLMAQQRHAN